MSEDIVVIEPEVTEVSAEEMKSRRLLTLIIYVLQGLSFLVGVTAVVAIIMNYVKRDDMTGTWLESHFRWQMRTFWYALLWAGVGLVLIWFSIISVLIIFANSAWVIYRIARGVLNLLDNKPMYR